MNIDKKEVKKFLATHPLEEISAARFHYTLLSDTEVEYAAIQVIKDLFGTSEQELDIIKAINEICTPDELLKYMRKQLSHNMRNTLMKKVLKNEDEMLLLIKEKCMTALRDIFIENAVYFFVKSKTNCCEWILKSYTQFRSEYLKSLLCLVLGFRGELDSIPFLMSEADRFLNYYPDETYDQGPIIAIEELLARFHKKI